MNTPPAPTTHLPAGFHLWWAVSTLHAAGSSMLAFALIWLATGHGPAAVALVSTVSVLPSLCLLLLGGALGDRHGPRSLLVATTLAHSPCCWACSSSSATIRASRGWLPRRGRSR